MIMSMFRSVLRKPVPRKHTNPYWCPVREKWFWYDETWNDHPRSCGGYSTCMAALRDLLVYCRELEIGPAPTRWERVWYELGRFWRDTRGQSQSAN